MAFEVFANQPQATVSSGGTTAPAAGTTETWTVSSSAGFPAASSSATPPTQFHAADIANVTEIITVTNVSGTTWTVTRGAEGTTPVAHAAGFTAYQVVTAGFLGSAVVPSATVTSFLAQSAGNRIISHRGLQQVTLEHAMVSYRAATAAMTKAGLVPAIKLDVNQLADGTLGVMHDSAVSRTTTTTSGTSANYTAQTWKTLTLNTALIGPAWSGQVVTPPLLTEVLDELGGKCVFAIEVKTATTAAFNAALAVVAARKLAGSVIFTAQDTTLTLPPLAAAAGIGFWFYWNTQPITNPAPATVIATTGVTALGIIVNQGNSYSDSDITTVVTAAHNAGLLATGSTYYRRYDYARAVSFSIDAHTVNDLAVTGSAALLTADLWSIGAPVPGEVGTTTPATASVSYPSYSYSGGTANYQRLIDGSVNGSGVGEACTFVSPAANSGSGKSYTVTMTVFFEATETQSSDGGRFAWVAIGFPDDRVFSANPQAPGYNILLRQGGGGTFANPTFQIMKQVPGAYLNNGSYASGTSTQQGANLVSTTGYAAPNTLSSAIASGAAVTSVTLGSAVTVPAGIKIKFANGQITSVSGPVTASATVPVTSFTATSAIANGSAVYFGIPCSFKLDATAANQTTLTVKRTDTNDTLTTTDTNTGGTGPYNGGYIHVGKTGTGAGSTLAVSFAALTIT